MALTRRSLIAQGGAALAAAPLLGSASAARAAPARITPKLELFAHRGSSALRPEHTLAS